MPSTPERAEATPPRHASEPPKRQRADARRNVAALLEAAKSVFASSGYDAPSKQITDLAGLGVGTLYRHFPRRSDLIVAVLRREIDECVAFADQLATGTDPWAAVTTWVERYTDFVATKRGLAAALHSGDPAYDDLPAHLLDQLAPALQLLLDNAAARGDVREGIAARDVLTAISLISHPVPGEHADFHRRMTRIFVDGLAAPGTQRRQGG